MMMLLLLWRLINWIRFRLGTLPVVLGPLHNDGVHWGARLHVAMLALEYLVFDEAIAFRACGNPNAVFIAKHPFVQCQQLFRILEFERQESTCGCWARTAIDDVQFFHGDADLAVEAFQDLVEEITHDVKSVSVSQLTNEQCRDEDVMATAVCGTGELEYHLLLLKRIVLGVVHKRLCRLPRG